MADDKLISLRSTGKRVHGDIDEYELQEMEIDSKQVIDFSTNINPYGPTETVLNAIRSARIDRYPDSTSRALRTALGAMHEVGPSEIVVGNGAADLLWTIARVYAKSNTKVLVVEPVFAEFRAACNLLGAEVVEWRAEEKNDFVIDVGSVADSISRSKADVVYICVPNSPTGFCCPAEDIKMLASKHPATMFVLDQCFLSLSEYHADAGVLMPENLIRVSSLTKDHSIPGIRIGYAIADAEICMRIEASRPSWTTNGPAQAAALAATKEEGFVVASREKMFQTRDYLRSELSKLGLNPLQSKTTFFLLPVVNAARVRRCLLRQNIVVRDCASFGLENHIRLAARPEDECDMLISALKQGVS